MRLALPLMLGIVAGWFCNFGQLHLIALLAVAVVALLSGLSAKAPRWLFGASVMAVMFLAGAFAENCQSNSKQLQWSCEKLPYSAKLIEVPAVRGTNVKVLASVALRDTVVPGVRGNGTVYLYFQRSVESEALSVGDSLCFRAAIAPPHNSGNPAEFDIESHYYIKGITGTAFLAPDGWKLLPKGKLSFEAMALSLRDKMITNYRSAGFENEELALLSALTLGEKRDFPQELKESYSAAGASHVLALSGLHLGIFYMLIMFFIPLRGRGKLQRLLRELAVVLLLWCFAFVAGLSPSVVRAAILFTLVSLGKCLGQEASSLNSLSFAAIVMLLFSPHLLFDISFQLSFAAVFSILLLVPPMQRLLHVEEHGAVYRYLVNLFLLSVAAQVGTLPFVWYYFGVFPLYFMLTNLFVVPLAFVVMLLAVIFWIASVLSFLQYPVAWLLGKALFAVNWCVEFVAGLPGASYNLPPLGLFGAVCLTVLLVLLLWTMLKRHFRTMAVVSGCALLLALFYLFSGDEKVAGDYLLVYNNGKNPVVHAVCSDGSGYIASTIPQIDAEYEYVTAPYINREGLKQPRWAASGYADSSFVNFDGIIAFSGLELRLVDSDLWQENIYTHPADAVLLCRGFKGGVKELLEVYPTGCLLLDGSLYKHSRKRILRECAVLGIDAVDISASGAVMIVPGSDTFDLLFVKER